jgi:Protein of unknown function (DUF3465)
MIELVHALLLVNVATAAGVAPDILLPASENKELSALLESINASKGVTSRYQLTDVAVLQNAYRNQVSNIQVLIQGRVVSLLSDDNNGSRHQRFIVQLSNAQTLLIAHNIDVAPRVSGLRVGDQLYIYGEYEWNSQGGVIHWTHHDPNRRHVDGWIDRNGVIFQ